MMASIKAPFSKTWPLFLILPELPPLEEVTVTVTSSCYCGISLSSNNVDEICLALTIQNRFLITGCTFQKSLTWQ